MRTTTFKNGKFYNSDGVQVPLEFGNKEQLGIINLLKELKSHDGIFFPVAIFNCPCGYAIKIKADAITKCRGCGLLYKSYLYHNEIPSLRIVEND